MPGSDIWMYGISDIWSIGAVIGTAVFIAVAFAIGKKTR